MYGRAQPQLPEIVKVSLPNEKNDYAKTEGEKLQILSSAQEICLPLVVPLCVGHSCFFSWYILLVLFEHL